jgi:hypothetical protein
MFFRYGKIHIIGSRAVRDGWWYILSGIREAPQRDQIQIHGFPADCIFASVPAVNESHGYPLDMIP